MKRREQLTGLFLNDPGVEVPENTILIVPDQIGTDGFYKEVVFSLKGNPKRDLLFVH